MAIPLTLKDKTESLAAQITKLAQDSTNFSTAVTAPALGFLDNLYKLLVEGQNDGVLTEERLRTAELLVSGYYFGFKENTKGISNETYRLIIETLEQSGWF